MLDELRSVAGARRVITDPARVEALSKDHYWYSPVLRARLAAYRAAAAVKVSSLDVLRRVIGISFREGVPVTVRGAATGNYGQSIPLHGGLIVDITDFNRILCIGGGVVTAEPGARLFQIEEAARTVGWELRCYPSTWLKATIGGFVAGGTGGIGSISWGPLGDFGTIKRLTVLTMEASPRLLVLEGGDTLKAAHTYGTNGILVEVQLRLAPAKAWEQVIIAGTSWAEMAAFADELGNDPSVAKRLLTLLEDPIPGYCQPLRGRYPAGSHLILLELEEAAADRVSECARAKGLTVPLRIRHHEPRRPPMLSDCSFNHTTLWAIKVDPSLTYLQMVLQPAFGGQIDLMRERFPSEMMFHLEFMRFRRDGVDRVLATAGPIIRFRSEERLRDMIVYCEEIGARVADPHTCYLGRSVSREVDDAVHGFKIQADPRGLLNPGKLMAHANDPFSGLGARPKFLFP